MSSLDKGLSKEKYDKLSILDEDFNKLISMDVDEVRKSFLNEIITLSSMDEEIRNERLQYLFEKLFKLQPDDEYFAYDHLLYSEQRLYMDLISTSGLKDIDYFRKFLMSDFKSDDKITLYKKRLLLHIFDYYDNHSPELINKFNYILRSSDRISSSLLKEKDEFDNYFIDDIMSFFSKEELAQIYKFRYMFTAVDFFSNYNRKKLFMISAMTKKVASIIGNSSDFLDNILNILNSKSVSSINFSLLLEEIYVDLVGSENNEAKFLDDLINKDCHPLILDFINSINNEELKYINDIINVSDFINRVLFKRDFYHLNVFKLSSIKDLKNGNFDKDSDFKDIENALDLKKFKESVLYNIYGIDFRETERIVKCYCQNIDQLEKDVLEEDKQIFSILKSIYNIVNLDIGDSNFKEKLKVIQFHYYDVLVNQKVNPKEKFFSSIILKGLFNKMYINTYNKRLLKKGELNVLELDQGVSLLDAGLEFNIMLNSIYGVDNNFYSSNTNMKSRWNTASFSLNQGICMSHISNQNLGVISLDGPLLGFSYIPEFSFNDMGPFDIYSMVNRFNLRETNYDGEYFVPGSIISDLTRFGYNEFLVDRFLIDDDNVKLQPDYVVFYKMCSDFKKTDLYKKTLKIAKDFNIPIVVVDVLKVKENEQTVVKDMEEELFSKEVCDRDLMNSIVVRYMNNYTGSLILNSVNEYSCEEDFSINCLFEFCGRLYNKIKNIVDLKIRRSWILAFKDVYNEEKRKYNEAKNVQNYGFSVKDFILDDIEDIETIFNLERQSLKELENDNAIIVLESGRILQRGSEVLSSCEYISSEECEYYVVKVYSESGEVNNFITDKNFSEDCRTIINFLKELNFTDWKFEVIDSYTLGNVNGNLIQINFDKKDEFHLVENLVISYFFENKSMLVNSLLDCDWNIKGSFNSSDNFDFMNFITSSSYKEVLEYQKAIDYKFLDNIVNGIENLDDRKFLEIFGLVINKNALETGERFEVIAGRLLDKKANIRKEFDSVLPGKFTQDRLIFKK